MSRSQFDNRRKVVFVTPRPAGESLRSARAVGQLGGVILLGIAEQLPEPRAADVFCDLAVVDDTHDSRQLIGAARKFSSRWGAIERIVTVHETLLAPVARASEALGLPGMSESAVSRALDKSSLKQSPAASRNRDGSPTRSSPPRWTPGALLTRSDSRLC